MPKASTYDIHSAVVDGDYAISIRGADGHVVRIPLSAIKTYVGATGGGSGGTALTVEEVDGGPSGTVTKLVFPNGTLTIAGGVGTFTPASSGSGSGGAGRSAEVTFIAIGNSTSNWTSQPAAITEFGGNRRLRRLMDTTGFTRARLVGNIPTAGAATAEVFVEYTTDLTGNAGWAALGTGFSLGTSSGFGVSASAKVSLPAGALNTDILVRVMGQNGDGTATPQFAYLALELLP